MLIKSLKTLIKIGKRNLDDLVIEKGSLISKKESNERKISQLISNLHSEQQKYYNSEFAIYIESYKKDTENKCQILVQEINNINNKIQEIEDNIREKFAEVKRFEILLDKKIHEQKDKEEKEEAKNLDEIATLKQTK